MRPTIEQVRAHFKDAEVVECLDDRIEYDIKNCGLVESWFCYWFDAGMAVIVWSERNGYAKIIK